MDKVAENSLFSQMTGHPAPTASGAGRGEAPRKSEQASKAVKTACWVMMPAGVITGPEVHAVDDRLRDNVMGAPIVRATEHILLETFCSDD